MIPSLQRLLSTHINSRPLNNSFGNRIRSLLFEPLDYSTVVLLINEISETINKYEDRVKIKGMVVETEGNKIIIKVLLEENILEIEI